MQHFIKHGSTVVGQAQSLVLPKKLTLPQYPNMRFKITSIVLDVPIMNQIFGSTNQSALYLSQKHPLQIVSKKDNEYIYYFQNCWIINSEGTPFQQSNLLTVPIAHVECEKIYSSPRLIKLKAFW